MVFVTGVVYLGFYSIYRRMEELLLAEFDVFAMVFSR